MGKWNNVPAEILQMIFQHLPTYHRFRKTTNADDVLQCNLVCKNWKFSAQQLLYTHVTLHCKDDLNKFYLGIVDNDQLPTGYVKKLSFGFTVGERVLQALSLKFPFVEHLSIPDPGADIYRTLITISRNQLWKNLKSLPIPTRFEVLHDYSMCVSTYRDSLASYLITDNPTRDVAQVDANSYDILWYNFNLCPHLTDIIIVSHHSDNQGVEYFGPLMESHLLLESISLEIYPSLETRLTLETQSKTDVTRIDLSKATPQKNISKLEFYGTTICDDNSLLYIIQAYPRLQYLGINVSDNHNYVPEIVSRMLSVADNFSFNVIAKFLTYLETVPSYELSLFFTRDMTRVYEQYLAISSTTLKTLSIVCRDAVDTPERDRAVEICMTNSNSFYRAGEKGFELKYNCIGADMPYLELFKRCGRSISDLTFLLNADDLDKFPTMDSKKIATGYILDHIFKYCPKLTRLDLLGMTLDQCDSEVHARQSITDLTLQDCTLSGLILRGLSIRLPSLKNLSLLYCNFSDTNPDIAACTYYLIDMPNIAFDTLIIEGRLKKLTLAVETTMQPHRYYNVFYSRKTDRFEAVSIEEDQYYSEAQDYSTKVICIQCNSINTLKMKVDFSYNTKPSYEVVL